MDLSRQSNRIIFFFITWIGGPFGIHWFVQKRYKKGFLYLFTAGGFIFCWIYDCVIAFINIFSYKQERFSKPQIFPTINTSHITYTHDKNNSYSLDKSVAYPNKVQEATKNNKPSNNQNELSFKAELNTYRKVIFLYSQNNKTISENDAYPRYMFYELGISNAKMFHEKLFSEGYLDKAPIHEILKSFKITELKTILKENNLIQSGKKDELIRRILENISEDILFDIQSKCKLLVLTQKGIALLEENKDYIQLHLKHSKWDIGIEEYLTTKRKISFKCSFNDVVWGILNDRSIKEYFAKDFSALSSTYYHMFELLEEENKIDQAYVLLLQTFYLDICGVDNILNTFYENIFDKNEMVNYINKYYEAIFTFAPTIIIKIIDYKDYYSDTLIEEVYATLKLPYSICPIELFKEIINDLFSNTIFDKDKYLKILRNNYIKFVKTSL